MKAQIIFVLTEFLKSTGYSVRKLCLEAGVSPATVSHVLTGRRQDMYSTNADALRAAMHRLATPGPSSERGEEDGSMSASQQDSSFLSHGGDCQQPPQRAQSSSNQGQSVTV